MAVVAKCICGKLVEQRVLHGLQKLPIIICD